ncbi:hypothetical protein BIV25_15825 [Streptomyces sp. MUSC 14]|uniref:hypothetical protein n=1 Tax=Streptomyces sp. MUSC 14 TaxID=1354889 RepID=UPI0008F569CE|nr:hypothetical protein [Streptomyces sp. MUSC 14]OIJ97239.1 hypothetical protein BIV25_15825 [Streptomyces sp. MUSC 14]
MSRETDTPSSGPNGRGGAAYPSGTPPYGTPMATDDGSGAGRSGSQPEEKKTETTLTTRIRINIPGSRPIPPVVVRKPVGDTDAGEDAPAADTRPAPERPAAAEAPAAPPAQADEKPSDWFAPRKSSAPKGGPGGGAASGPGTQGGATGATGAPAARPGGPGATGTAGTTGARSGGGRPGGVVGSMSVPGAGRSGTTNGTGLPGATGGPVAPGHGGGTGSFDVTEALNAGPLAGGSRSGPAANAEPRRDELPYFSENGGQDTYGGAGAPGHDGFGTGASGANGHGGASGLGGPNGPGGLGGGPAGPTSGPVTGDGALAPSPGGPRPGGDPFAAPGSGDPFGGPAGGEPFGSPAGGFDAPGGRSTPPPRSALADIADLDGPTAPGAPAAPLGGPGGLGPGGGISDDTAILTPQKPAPEPGTPGYRRSDNVSGHTVTSGIPVVPSGGNSPFGGPGNQTAPGATPEPAPAPKPKAQAAPKKKGRSKLVLLGVGVVVVAGGAYGAGLLMNHTDVPKGTTVLGVDIGGGTRDDAVKKLDDAFGSRVNKPLKLTVDGRTVALTPENAGLQFDFQATVGKAATSDYNPISVIGSLFGQKRVIAPEMPVDEEKLQAALQQAGGGSGLSSDGTIRFEAGRAVAVYGKAGKGIDAASSTQAVEQAYRTAVETDTAAPVALPTTTQQPTVPNAEVDREMKQFAEPAMSGKVTVMTDAAHSIPMSPQKSLWKFLRVKAVNGKLVDSPDMAALQQLYGNAFNGVLITRGNGKKTPVTPQDVYGALRQALMSKTNRVAVISTNPS